MIDIRVTKSGVMPRIRVDESARGVLTSIEQKHLPFSMQRVYTLTGVSDSSQERGAHAHRATDQVMYVVQGALTLHLDDGATKQDVRLTSADEGVRLGPALWHSMSDFTPDCVALVIASAPYDESDYIRDYEEFKRHVSSV